MNPFYSPKWMELSFGKHKGKTLPQVAFHFPSYFFWAMDEGIFDREPLKSQADDVYFKLRNIRIPEGKGYVAVRYCVDRRGRFDYFLLCQEHECYLKDRFTYANDIDCTFPYRMDSRDKGGCQRFMRHIQGIFIGPEARLTKDVCELFFDQDIFNLHRPIPPSELPF